MSARCWNFVVASVAAAALVSLCGAVPARAAVPPAPTASPVEKLDRDGGPVSGRAWTQKKVRDTPVTRTAWPEPATARVELPTTTSGSSATSAPRRVRVGDLPVWVGDAPGTDARLSSLDVQLIDRATVPTAWRDSLVMRISAPKGANAGNARLTVDYRGFQQAYGAGWASRLKLWRLPQCALTNPDGPACRSQVLPTSVDAAAGTVSATVNVASTAAPSTTGSLVALSAAAAGKDGDFGATTLAPSSTWSAGDNSGDFSWSYPMRVPPAAGPTPDVALSYSSSAVDGRSEVTNNQPSWIGEGFDYSPGYIERRYVPCSEDSKNGANSSKTSGDLCWRSDNATISFGGHSGELIYQNGKG